MSDDDQPKVTRMGARLAALIEDGLERLSNEPIEYDFTLVPSPQGGMAVAVSFWVSSPILGQVLNFVAYWNPCGMDQEKVDGSLREALGEVDTARSNMLAQEGAVTNGGGPLPGLLKPPGL